MKENILQRKICQRESYKSVKNTLTPHLKNWQRILSSPKKWHSQNITNVFTSNQNASYQEVTKETPVKRNKSCFSSVTLAERNLVTDSTQARKAVE